MRVEIVVYDGFDELDAIGPYEVLRNAAMLGADLDVALVARDGAPTVTASHGLQLMTQGTLTEWPDVLVVPGGGWNDRAPQGARAEVERGELPAIIAHAHAAGTTVASICTGGMLVAAAGLTKGRPAITHRGAIAELRAMGAEVIEDVRVVDHGDLLMSGGVTAGMDLALWFVERGSAQGWRSGARKRWNTSGAERSGGCERVDAPRLRQKEEHGWTRCGGTS